MTVNDNLYQKSAVKDIIWGYFLLKIPDDRALGDLKIRSEDFFLTPEFFVLQGRLGRIRPSGKF